MQVSKKVSAKTFEKMDDSKFDSAMKANVGMYLFLCLSFRTCKRALVNRACFKCCVSRDSVRF